MEKVKYLVCGDVKKPQRNFGDAGVDCFVPNKTEQFIEDIKNCNSSVYVTEDSTVSTEHDITINSTGIVLKGGSDIKFPLYIRSLIESNMVLMVTNKSGVCTKQKLIHGADTIDSSYQLTHHAHLINFSDKPQTILFGQKIIQEVPFVINPENIEVYSDITSEQFYEGHSTERTGGFGSTGVL